jgi:Transglutaminase-like superfamily
MARTVSTSEVLTSPSMKVGILFAIFTIPVSALLLAVPFGWRYWGLLHRVRHTFKSHHLALVAVLVTALFLVCIRFLSHMVLVKAQVCSIKAPWIFSVRKLPGFIEQNRNSEALAQFRCHLNQVLSFEYPDSLSKVVAIRRWVRRQQSQDESVWLTPARASHEDPHRLLRELKEGTPGSCRRFSYILLGALLSAGFEARIVGFAISLNRRNSRQHMVVEVWLEELGQWVLLDPTFDTLISVDGKVASAIELYEAIINGDLSRIAFGREDAALMPHPSLEVYDLHCRHMFVAMSNAIFDGYAVRIAGPRRIRFLHYGQKDAYPEFRKQILLGVAGCSLFLSLVFWTWSLFTLASE